MASESVKTKNSSRVTVIPTGKALGAEVQGIDLRIIGEEDFANIYRAWLRHSVLLIRGAEIDR